MKPRFTTTERPGLGLFDPVQDRRFELETSSPVDPSPVGTDRFRFPVDAAVEVAVDQLVLPYVVETYVRDPDGSPLVEAEHYAYEELPPDEYCLELHAPIKTFVRVDGEVTVASSVDRMEFDFGEETAVRVGARSYHERPAATVTTTADPEDLMAAVSTFGSALKTTSPERSFPTLRGHPPTVELGDDLAIPDGLDAPDTGVHIEVPTDRQSVYAVSTLAYYLGADVRPGERPRIVTADGFEHSLRTDRGFDAEVARVLQQVFLLDCLTRTEGLYPVDLHERQAVEDDVSLSFPDLYDAPSAERLAAYLSVPFDAVRDAVPTWRLAAHVTPDAENATLLPYLVDDLAVVRRADAQGRRRARSSMPSYVDEFVRSVDRGRRARSDEPYVSPPETDALEQAWLGDGRVFGANELRRAAFEHRDRETTADDIDIDIVCNDERMREEVDVEDGALYGDRADLPFDVTVHANCSTETLAELLASETDFLHYVGHVEAGGFVCPDGVLDAESLDRTGARTFFLNGCNSYRQGVSLVENGSIGGIVTHGDVGNGGATAVGRLVARLLNAGFSLRSALAVVRERRIVANQYTVVGDGGVEVAQNESGIPVFYRVRSTDADGEYGVRIDTYPTSERGMGSLYIPYVGDVETHFIAGGPLPEFRIGADELGYYLQMEQFPVVLDGSFCWSTDLGVDDLR
ncbi:hypothetical protein [Halomicrococcus sp. NG-SE-24]|uniref:hypothetical protein n=1 Tax=Halomicrococcus sp. NG-SE-24 TaxID=3436928 RepID=UPI003D975249